MALPLAASESSRLIRDHRAALARLRLLQRPPHQKALQAQPQVAGLPGTEAEEIGQVGGIDPVDPLPVQGRQRLLGVAHHQGISDGAHMAVLRFGERHLEVLDEPAEGRRWV
ncbi:MAG: hypothetical protein HY690_19960 [Chloroflexi bacterium]|nr:hypothetical protein [Chloroflexota bacterium]